MRIREEEIARVSTHLHDSVLQSLVLIQRSDDSEAIVRNRLRGGACPDCTTPIPGRWDARVEGTTRTHGVPLPVWSV